MPLVRLSALTTRRALTALAMLGAMGAPCVAHAQARPAATAPATTPPPSPGPARTADDLARARALDQQGAKAFADGRYNDAIRYFEESHRLGGPPFELWNIAKCYVRLDQPEQAAEMLERYLATTSLPSEDRDDATTQLDSLRRRPSTVTIASSPTGAVVTLDGRPVEGGKTPTSFNVQPGTHTITVTLPLYAVYTQQVDARYGRAIILDAPLSKDRHGPPPQNPYGEGEIQRFALRGDLGIMIPRYGSVGGAPHVTMAASGAYRFADVGATAFGAGVMMLLTGDAWDNTVGSTDIAQPCGRLRDSHSATALSLYAMGTAGWEIAPRLRAHALAGVGIAAYFAGDLGGDVFSPACSPSPAAKPTLMMGGQLDYAVTPIVRLSALPLVLQVQPSFDGARITPVDTSGVWLRATIAIGAGVDL